MDTELMDFLNKYTSYDFGYIKTILYINEEGKLESQYNQTEDSSDIISYGLRQKTLLYGVNKTEKQCVTPSVTILDDGESYNLLEQGILKLENVSKEDIKKHMLYNDYLNENYNVEKPYKLGELPKYEDILKEKGILEEK